MGATIAEKILSSKVDRRVSPGEIIQFEHDLACSHDVSTAQTVEHFENWGGDSVADPDRIAIVPDHLVPSHNEYAQRVYNRSKRFAEEYGIEKFYPLSKTGLMHAVLPEDGLIKPGDVVIGADSHTNTYGAMGVFGTAVARADLAFSWIHGWTWLRVPETVRVDFEGTPSEWVSGKDLILHTLSEIGADGGVYRSIEFGGETVGALDMDSRFSMTNMTTEGGAMVAFVDPDETTRAYVDERVHDDYELFEPDPDAEYVERHRLDVDGMEPQIAVPESPANTVPVDEVVGIEVQQSVIGSCTNCRASDLEVAARILEGHEIDPDVRLIITPGTRKIQTKAFEEGWMKVFNDAGATMSSPGCGACFGRHIGVLDEDETSIATINRNYLGRLGPDSSRVYLSNPAVAAASAITGEITHPEEVM